jgi:hypothetical protein
VDGTGTRLYEVELWNAAGQRVADISRLCLNRNFTVKRNDVGTFTFDLNVYAFEQYCLNNLGGLNPRSILEPDVTDVKLKRKGQYLYGFQVVDMPYSGSGADLTVTVQCTSYLNFFKDRYITKTYSQQERVSIATDAINTTQSQTNGSLGITIAPTLYATGALSDENYQLDNVKLKIQELPALSDAPFDFDFTWDKVFHTYSMIGARRADINLIYGGPLGNVAGFSFDRNGTSLYNKIYALGSGFGTDQLTSTQADSPSQLKYYLRENIEQHNSVTAQGTLDQDALADLALSKDMLALPVFTITGKELPSTFLSVGDRIPCTVVGHSLLADINGLYRIEEMDVTLDENDFESAIKLTFDSYGVNQNEQPN